MNYATVWFYAHKFHIANAEVLAQIVVLKPLAPLTVHILTERLAGLANRPIFTFPFSRKVAMDIEKINAVGRLFNVCMQHQSVIVAQPEQLLSFKLMAIVVKGSQLPRETVEKLADKILVEGDPLVHPKKKFLKEYENLTSSS